MKRILRIFLISIFSLWVVNHYLPNGLVISEGILSLLKVAAGLTVANLVVKPLISMVMLPVNLLFFGLFRWVTNVLVLWLVARFVGGVTVQAFTFSGANLNGVIIPAMSFNYLFAWIVVSFLIAFISGFIIWLISK